MFYSTIFFHLLTRDKLFNCDIFFPRKSNRFAFREIRLMGNVFILFIFDLSKSRVERAYPRKSSVLRDCVASGFPFAPRYARDCSTFFYFISFFFIPFPLCTSELINIAWNCCGGEGIPLWSFAADKLQKEFQWSSWIIYRALIRKRKKNWIIAK